ncbi:MAG: hypothetical protein IJB86_00225 [Clostridia bacterium]|nr:hypothetical protein [Clostridia bacterium]
MINRILRTASAVLMVLSVLLSLSSCGSGGIQAVAVDVDNGTFFQDTVREYYKSGNTISESSRYFALASSFSMSKEDFIKNFLQQYDSNFGMDLKILITNGSDKPITVKGVRTDKNGYEATYISSLVGFGNSVTLEPSTKTEITVHFLGNGGIYTNEEFLEVVMKEMDIRLLCAYEDTGEEKLLKIRIKPDNGEVR